MIFFDSALDLVSLCVSKQTDVIISLNASFCFQILLSRTCPKIKNKYGDLEGLKDVTLQIESHVLKDLCAAVLKC